MDSCLLGLFAFLLVASVHADNTSFNTNYNVTWGFDHATLLSQETELRLSLDQLSGSGFESKMTYGSGFFHMRIKIPYKDSRGVLTAFYLTSKTSNHDELDFEFLGNNIVPYTLQTNVFTNGGGNREQRIHLWFDPTKDFHSYKILWNPYQVVFFVDDVPIRVFKNNAKIGVSYPIQPIYIVGSLWNAESWASGGKKINWSQAPFIANLQQFNVDGCIVQNSNTQQYYFSNLWWNTIEYSKLNANQQTLYEYIRST